MSDRVFATIWLFVCVIIVWQMWHLSVPFAYEPVGPKAFPILLSVLMAACCAWLLANPDSDIHWPEPRLLGKGASLIVVLLFYAGIFESIGFPLATALMVTAVSMIFGASWRVGLVTGVLVGGLGYAIFDYLLQVSLPIGRLWS